MWHLEPSAFAFAFVFRLGSLIVQQQTPLSPRYVTHYPLHHPFKLENKPCVKFVHMHVNGTYPAEIILYS